MVRQNEASHHQKFSIIWEAHITTNWTCRQTYILFWLFWLFIILDFFIQLLMDKDRLVKRTQLKRSVYEVCDETKQNPEDMKDRHLKDYDEEIFDDQDFYNQLMRELIDRQTSNVLDPVELSRKSIELQSLRNKNKKKVDTKASKGRKIKFDVHKPMVNFMAPIFRCKMSDEAR